jgi:hypothetical protein
VTPERWSQLKNIFHGALDQPAAARHAWLDHACGGDAELLREARALLTAHDTAGDLLEHPAQVAVDDDETLEVGANVGEHYQINGILGRGGMGIVYLAHDYRLGRRVALKALPPSVAASPPMRERLRREARAAATISHPAVATVYALEEIDGHLYIASEYVPGPTLASEIAKGPIAESVARSIAAEIAAALAAAHAAGVVHRDLKPDNVLLTSSGVKVVDFGIAHIEAPEATRLTKAGAMLGTPAYMAPEQLLGGPVDARADIYAFGVVLSEMLTGRHPLQAASPGHRSLDEPAAPVSSSMTTVITRCVQTDPAARYASAQELLDALKRGGPDRSPLYDADAGAGAQARRTDARWWWEFHQLAAAVVYCAMVYPAWLGRGVLGGLPGRALFILTLAAVIVSVTLRAHLWFTARSYGDHLDWARQRNGPWVLAADGIFALTLISGGLAIGDSPLGITLLSVGIGAAAAALVVEPVTTRAAFKELTN